jgi:hypothetical protein
MSGFSQFAFGPKIGINFTNFVNKSSMNNGVDVGVFLRMGKSFYFQPEFKYSYSNSSLNNSRNDDIEKIKNHYFNIPLLVGYKFINYRNFNFRLFIGPQLGFMMNNNYESEDNPLGTMQIGGQVGFGMDIWRFTLDCSYDLTANQPNTNLSSTAWWGQNKFCISLGFKIINGKGQKRKGSEVQDE